MYIYLYIYILDLHRRLTAPVKSYKAQFEEVKRRWKGSWRCFWNCFWRFSRARPGIYKLSPAGISKGCDFEGSVEQSIVSTVFSMVFTSSVELAFRRDAILKAQSSKALYSMRLALCLQAQSSLLFEVTAILKSQSSKELYLLCLEWYLQAQSSWWRLSWAKHGI